MANSEILNKLEKDRLKDLNDRTVCIRGGQADKPTTNSLLTLGLKHQSIQRTVKSKQAYIFIIFGNLGIKLSCELNEIYSNTSIIESKWGALDRLDGVICDGARISLNYDTKLVPVDEDELAESRLMTSLAVHGLPWNWKTAVGDLLHQFPHAICPPLLHCPSQGTIFLKYHRAEDAVQVSCQ